MSLNNACVVLVVTIFLGSCLADSHHEFVRTPAGLFWSECIFEVPHGSHIFDDEAEGTKIVHPDGTGQYVPNCRVPSSRVHSENKEKAEVNPDGWQVWSSYNTPDNSTFASFLGDFNVPDHPTKWNGGVVYLFTALQNDNWIPAPPRPKAPAGFEIIQPVLQYGQTTESGWTLASWYVTLDDTVLKSKVLKVSPGEVLFGNMTQLSNDTWFIGSEVSTDKSRQTSLKVTRPRLINNPWAYCTLEVYGLSTCDNFPPKTSPVKFTNLKLTKKGGEAVTPKWNTFKGDNPCNGDITVSSPESVTIIF